MLTPANIGAILGYTPLRVLDTGAGIVNIYYEGNLCQSYSKNSLIRLLLKGQQ